MKGAINFFASVPLFLLFAGGSHQEGTSLVDSRRSRRLRRQLRAEQLLRSIERRPSGLHRRHYCCSLD